jgi:sphinganine-1-phosphate aldolase
MSTLSLVATDFKGDYFLPQKGASRDTIRERIDRMIDMDPPERAGLMSIYTNRGSDEGHEVMLEAFSKVYKKNNLVAVLMPGMRQMEEQLLSMCANLLSGGKSGVVANITAGGTESIFCAINTAREWSRAMKPGISAPEFVAPYSAHAALNKAGQYLGVKIRRIPVGADYRSDMRAIGAAIGPNTIGLYASAPNWPYGTYDHVAEFGQLALRHDIWLHVDACVGGFVAPFVKKAGYPVPPWDFSVPGVTSISADLHKFAYAMKPASVVAYRNLELQQKYHYVKVTEWPTIEYSTQGVLGSRSAGPVAAAWAMMHYLGEEGYLRYAKQMMEAKQRLAKGINAIAGLKVNDTELIMLCYESTDDRLSILEVVAGMERHGWLHFGTLEPPMIQLVMEPKADPLIPRYLADLADIVERIRKGETFGEGELHYSH